MEWGAPQNFIVLWAAVGLLALFVWADARKRSGYRRFGDAALVERLAGSLDRGRRALKRFVLVLAVVFLAVALAQPHFRKKETKVETKGIDLFIAIDVSRSMLAKDIPPTRLEKAKLELSGLIDRLPSDRVGLVAFAGEAIIQCPLTLDRGAAKLFLSTVSPELVPYQGTALAKSIETAVNGFPKGDKDKDSRALILLTDGEDQEPGAVAAAKKALGAGVHVYVIGIGTPDGSVIPSENGQGYKRDRGGQIVLSKLNESLLRDIARAGGGAYWRASRGDLETGRIIGELRRLSQKSMGTGWSVEYEENFQIFLILAWMLLAIEMMLSETKRRED